MTIAEYRKKLRAVLTDSFPDEGDAMTDIMLCEALDVPRSRLYTSLMEEMPLDAAEKINGYVSQLANGIPLQYVLGRCNFYGCEVKVGNGVFIPRSDTETIVKTALAALPSGGRFADLCSGSGCIPLAIVSQKPTVTGVALELSRKALPYTEKNLAGKNVKVIRFDVLDEDDYNSLAESEGLFDVVTCNPPYIPTDDIGMLSTQVLCEPESALDGGEDGLRYYRAVTELLPIILKPQGTVVYEVGYDQADAVCEILQKAGYAVGKVKDLGGIERCVFGKKY